MKQVKLINSELVALVDDEDFERVSETKWILQSRNKKKTANLQYVRSSSTPYRALQTEVMGEPSKGLEWDHHDRNPLNNQKQNLRSCTRSQNCANQLRRKRSGFKGVFRVRKKWRVIIRVNYKAIDLGYYSDQKQAARVYDVAAVKYFGEFARTNF